MQDKVPLCIHISCVQNVHCDTVHFPSDSFYLTYAFTSTKYSLARRLASCQLVQLIFASGSLIQLVGESIEQFELLSSYRSLLFVNLGIALLKLS